MQEMLYFIAWILFPLIPSYFCYKVLKNQDAHDENYTRVKGRILGLTIETGGAFAIYFTLFICIHFYFGTRYLDYTEKETAKSEATKEMWLVKCKVDLIEDNNKKLSEDESNENFEGFSLNINPPIYSKPIDGEVSFYLPSNLLDEPTASVQMDVPGFRHVSLKISELNNHKIKDGFIDVGEKQMKRTPLYQYTNQDTLKSVTDISQLHTKIN